MNTSVLKYSLLTLLIGMSTITVQASKADCPMSQLIHFKKALKETPGPIIFSALTTTLIVWVYKLRNRGADWNTRFDKSKLGADTLRQIWYFIADEVLGHAGDVTKVKVQHVTNDGVYEVNAVKEVCAPHGALGSILGYADEILDTKTATASVAAIIAWITAHKGQCPCNLLK